MAEIKEIQSATTAYAEGRNLYIKFTSLHSPSASVKFKAFITSLTQDFNSNWNTQTVFGRMDPIRTFQNTQRTINLSWKTTSVNAEEAAQNLKKINLLTRMLYPTYDDPSTAADLKRGENSKHKTAPKSNGFNVLTIAKPPLIRVSFVNWIQAATGGLLCSIDGFSYEPDFSEEGVFDYNNNIVPKTIAITCNITVLHEHELGWDQNGNWKGAASFPFASNQPSTAPSTSPPVNQKNNTENQASGRKAEDLSSVLGQGGAASQSAAVNTAEVEESQD